MMIAFSRLKPEVSFAEATPPAAPDYSQVAELGGAAGSRGRRGRRTEQRRAGSPGERGSRRLLRAPDHVLRDGRLEPVARRRLDQPAHRHVRPAQPGVGVQQLLPDLRAALSAGDDLLVHGRAGERQSGAAAGVRGRGARVRLLHRALQPGTAVHSRGAQPGLGALAHAAREAHHRHAAARAARRRLPDRLRHRSRRTGEGRARRAGVRLGRADRLCRLLERHRSAGRTVGRSAQEHLRESADVAHRRCSSGGRR